MSRLDDLPPDQRAVLLLLVAQGKSHAEIAEMLDIPQSAVRNRARAALDALADGPSEIHGAAHQQAGDGSGQTRTSTTNSLPSSKRGGALLLAALIVIVVVAVILITSGGGSNKTSSTQASTTTPARTPSATKTSGASSTSSTASTTKPTVDKQIALTSPKPGSKAIGLVEVLSEASKHAIYLAAEHLPSPPTGSFYAVWLYNSPTSSTPLGKTPTVGSNGRLQAGTLLPTNAGAFHEILLTRETNSRATHPGPTVLSGSFSLGH